MKKIQIISMLPIIMLSFPAFSAEEQSVRLQDTIVSTKGFSSASQEESKNISVISNQDIENKGYTDLSEIFANSPYINVKSGEKGSDRTIDIRGQGKNSLSAVKIMVDGISLNILDTSHSQSPLNSINPSQIDQVEIIPGGGSVLYGNNATGGTVNVITKADNQKEYRYIQNLYKSYNTNDLSMGIGQKLNDNFYVNFDYSFVDGNGYRDLDERKAQFVSGGVTYNVNENHKVSFNAKYSKDNGITSDGITKEALEQNRKQAGEFISNYKNTTSDYSVKYDGKITDKVEISAKAYYQETRSDNKSSGTMTIAPSSEYYGYLNPMFCSQPDGVNYACDGFMNGDFKENKIGANLKSKFSHNTGNVIVGYDYLNNKLDRYSLAHLEFLPNPALPEYDLDATNNLSKDTHSAFILLEQKIANNLNFNTGYRYEVAYYDIDKEIRSVSHNSGSSFKYKKHDNNQAYNAGISYDLNSLNKIYINYERGYVSPSPVQLLDKEVDGKTSSYVPNNLKSQTGDNYEIGYKGFALNSYFSLTTFYSQNNNEIVVTDMNLQHTEWHYKNLDKTRRSGVEAFAEQNVWKFTLSEGATYINTRVLEGEYKGQEIATVPDFKVVLSAKYEVIQALNLGLRMNYTSKYLENNFDSSTTTESYAPSVVTTDLFLDYSPINKLYVLAGVNNLLNEEYNISQDSYGNYVVAPERSFYLGLKYEF